MPSSKAVRLRAVKDITLASPSSSSKIVEEMGEGGGFVGRHLAEAVDILTRMVQEPRCTKFLSFPAAPVATGLRGVLKELVRRRFVDVIITTCGTLDHDLARSWATYYEGDFQLDDAALLERGFHRLGNVLIPRDSYGPLIERRLQPILQDVYNSGIRELSSHLLCKKLGEALNNPASLLYWAWRNQIPIVVPGLTDGAVGSQIWLFSQGHHDFKINPLLDQEILSETVFSAAKTGALIIGGGISKHHTLWWNQFRSGLDYAVYITTAVEYDGSLSGAQVREAVSWGKVKPKAKHVTIYADATAVLPFMIGALLERVEARTATKK